MTRPDWDAYGLGVAAAVAVRGDCTRRQVGAVILDTRHRLAGAGYNGSYPGGPSCLEGDCPRGRHYKTANPATRNWRLEGGAMTADYVEVCACGNEWPCPDAVAPGSSYDTGPGACIATHAESNALADVDNRGRLDGATMYVTCEPCDGCVRHIRNTTGLAAIRWPEGYIALP